MEFSSQATAEPSSHRNLPQPSLRDGPAGKWEKIAEDRARGADTRPAQSFSPETVFAPCQRRKHHHLSSSSIRG